MIEPTYYPRAQQAFARNPRLTDLDLVGYTPQFLDSSNPDDAVAQLHTNYGHGGGWHDMRGFTLDESNPDAPLLRYPDDPPTEAVAYWKLRDERIILFDHAWVAVVQPGGSFRVSRMD